MACSLSLPSGLIALLVIAASPILPARPLISEFLANNATALEDADGDSSDWIEIWNPGPDPLELGGYALTDDPDDLRLWTFPDGTALAANDYLVVFASGKNRATAGGELHTSFSLDADGEYLALVDPAGVILQEFTPAFPKQRQDISYGSDPDSATGFLSPPTPGTANGPLLQGFVKDTVFSHKRGIYSAPVSLVITTETPDAQIRFTLDGSKPTPDHGTLYTGPIPIGRTTVLRALAYKDGMVPTNVDAQTFVFPNDVLTQPRMNSSIVRSPTYRVSAREAIQALPVVSLSFENSDLFGARGIHSNPLLSGRTSEREIHFEFFDPATPGDSTHEPGGVRIHGGNSREHPKKNFRIYFRSDYGKSRLKHPLFPGSPVTSFKTLLLRGGGHDAWTFRGNWNQATLLRNEFLHRVQLSMGQPSPRGRMVTLFLNGDYWGVYELQELPHQWYNADHHGGDPDDWDVIKHGQEVESGNLAAWNEMLSRARRGISSPGEYHAIQEFVDVDHFADAMIQRIWSSDEDWLSPEFRNGADISIFNTDKNWYVARKSRNGSSKFFFYSWDAEMSMGIPFAASRSFENDFTQVNNDNSPGIIYDRLRRYPEFRLRFADRLHKHMFNGGALTPLPLRALWEELAAELQDPIVGESARWGLDSWSGNRSSPYTRDGEWLPAVDWVRRQFLARRTGTVLNQFRRIGLYPSTAAPTVSPAPGRFVEPLDLALSTNTSGGTVYFTTDGSDPRTPETATVVPLVGPDHPISVLVPDAAINSQLGTTWRHFNDPANLAAWTSGLNGAGFEGSPASTPNFSAAIRTPVAGMQGRNATAYIRIPFDIPDQETLDSLDALVLRMRFDDGFNAFLNGTQIESQNARGSTWNASASTTRDDQDALELASFDQTANLRHLVVGRNVLAIQGLNRTANDDDFLIEAHLDGISISTPGEVSPRAVEYVDPLALAHSTRIMARTRAPDGSWSALTDLTYWIGAAAAPGNLLASEIHYHPADPGTPEERAVSTNDSDFEFLELHNLDREPLDLSLCRFANGLDFEFPMGTLLAPRGYQVLVSNRAAFVARYGSGLEPAILGEFAGETNLSNGGERLTLLDANGGPIFDFEYDDRSSWPTTPDGEGPSLVLMDPLHTPAEDLGKPTRWRAAFLDGGAPGVGDEMSFELWTRIKYGHLDSTDPDKGGALVVPEDSGGLTNLQLYAHGQDLSNRAPEAFSSFGFTRLNDESYLTMSIQLRDDLAGVTIVPEVSTDLENWTPTVGFVDQYSNGDGTSTLTVRDLAPAAHTPQRFIRLRLAR